MAPLLTTGQSRWALHILLSFLSIIAIASSAPHAAGGTNMYSGNPGDIRGPAVLIGSIGLGGSMILRTAFIFLPKPWRVYLDRLEFAFVSMLWISWTSATMAFSAFTLDQGVCSTSWSEYYLPSCPLLTFDLVLLHLLSVTTLALLLVILSTALSPTYYMANSTALPDQADGAAKIDPDSVDAFVMWDFALASPPHSPRLEPTTPSTPYGRSYGTQSPTTPLQANPYAQTSSRSAATPSATPQSPKIVKKGDKFAEGRLWSYIPLGLCSIGSIGGTGVALTEGSKTYGATSFFMMAIAGLTLGFAVTFVVRHFVQKKGKSSDLSDRSMLLRHDRALEIGLASVLFVVWPLAAITYTLFPPTPNRPCTNPAASLSDPPALNEDATDIMCIASITAVALAWSASWLILVRVLGLVIPLPEMGRLAAAPVDIGQGAEAQSLLRNEQDPGGSRDPPRPQVKWGRMVAGEAFELGDDEE